LDELIRVGLVDSDTEIRAGRKIILQSSNRISVILELGSSVEILEKFADYLLDVLVVDQRLKGLSGAQVVERLTKIKTQNQIDTRLLLTAPFASPKLTYEALEAGAAAVVTQDEGAGALLEAVHSLATRRRQYSLRALRAIVQQVGIDVQSDPALDAHLASLPEQESRIVELVVSGASVREVSDTESLPPYQVRKLLQATLRTLGVATLEQLQLRYIRAGRLGAS
jgi:DNA-binding NarL/FixJ family response regulator